jgi:hypothetical protein
MASSTVKPSGREAPSPWTKPRRGCSRFGAAGGAYALTQIIAYTLGLFALALSTGEGACGPFLSVTLGAPSS